MNNRLETINMGGFGNYELEDAAKLLQLLADNKFYCDSELDRSSLTVNFNPSSGIVFLSDDSYITYILGEDENENECLVRFLYCHECGHEFSEIDINGKDFACPECGKDELS